jgi:hypothetical protein
VRGEGRRKKEEGRRKKEEGRGVVGWVDVRKPNAPLFKG